MQKHTLLFTFLLTAIVAQAQTSAKRYVFIEHFTNSKCIICSNKNPAFFSLIDQYPDDIHHIAIYPPIPYNTCAFYLANPTENSAWSNSYGINATPRVALNGTLIPLDAQLLSSATLQMYLNQTSPIWIQVNESGSGANRTATVKVHSLDQSSGNTFKLFAAVVEKSVAAPPPPNNGEQTHHDVFRDMLTDITGMDITLPAAGQFEEFTFNYAINPAWNANEVYVTVWIQNPVSKEVLNSGTRFDPVLTVAGEAAPQSIQIQPNPVSEIAFARIGEDIARQVEVFAINGQRISTDFESQETGLVSIPTATLKPGIYFVKITGEKGMYVAKMVKN